MVVRLSDIRSGKKEEKKSGVVRLSDIRKTTTDTAQEKFNDTIYGGLNKLESTIKESRKPKTETKKPLRVDPVKKLADKIKTDKTNFDTMDSNSTNSAMASQAAAKYGYTPEELAKVKAENLIKYADRAAKIEKIDARNERLRSTAGIGNVLKSVDVLAEKTKPFADIAQEVYTPGGGLSVINSATKGVGALISKIAPRIGNGSGLLARGVTKAIEEAVTGAPLGAGNVLAKNPEASRKEILTGTAYGSGGGALIGGLSPVAGKAIQVVSNKLRNISGSPSQLIEEAGRLTDETTLNQTSDSAMGETSNRPVRLNDLRNAEPTPSVTRERGLIGNIESSGKLNDEAMSAIKKGDTTHETINNVDTVNRANERLNTGGMDSNKGYLLNKNTEKDYFSPEDIALGFRLIDEYSAIKDYESVADLVHQLSKAGTKGGQSIQINAIFNRLTPEGVLKVATRVLNEGVKDVKAQKALSPQLTEQLSTAAIAMREASGKEGLAKEAITIIEKARTGAVLSPDEVMKIRAFANEAKKLLPKTERVPTPTGDRVVDKVKKASASAADAARKRLRNARNIGFAATGQGNAVVDYAIIGFDHMMNGTVKFADFAGKMRTEFGDGVEQYLDKAYLRAFGKYRKANNLPQSEFEKITNKAISGKGFSDADADALRKMAIELSQLEGTAKSEALAELQIAFNTLREGTRGKKAASVLRSLQLGNARTIIRNEISNNAFYGLEQIKRKFLDTPIDVVASTVTGKDREIFWKGNPNSWPQYFKDWKTGYVQGRKGLNPGGLQSQYDLGNLAFNPTSTKLAEKLGSFLERNVGAFLKAGDYAASNRAISTELNQLARAKAYAEGFRGKDLARKTEEYFHTADDVMSAQAEDYGKYMTFQDKNFLSDAAVNLRDKVLNAGKDFGLGNIVLNYPKTPANILMRAIDYSPLGYVKFMTQVGKAIAGKDVTKKQLINTFTRALAGTGIAGMGLYLSQLGILNVLPSKNAGVSELERKAGKIPNSLNIDALKRYVLSFGDKEAAKPRDGDTYASVDWFQPLAIPLSVGAAYGQADQPGRLKTSINAADVATQSIDAALESFGNMSAYKNIKDLVGSSYSTPSEKLGKLSANAASAFVPSVLGQARNVIDPYQRESKEPGFFGQAKGQLMNRIPGLSNKLPVRVDAFGDEKKNDFSVGKRILNAFVNPSIVDTYKPSPEAKTVLDLIQRTGESRLAPDRPKKSFVFKKETLGFTPEDYLKYQKATGELITEGLQKNLEYLNNPDISDEKKVKRVDQIISAAGDRAKKDYRKFKGIR